MKPYHHVMPDGAGSDGAGSDGAAALVGGDGASAVAPSQQTPTPTSVHQAIDYLTAALLDAQQIRRSTEGSGLPDELDEQLHRLEGTLQRLGSCLLEIRGKSR